MADSKENIYKTLSKIDVSKFLNKITVTSKKSHKTFSLYYLSWAKALGLVKTAYPDTTYSIKEYPNWQMTEDGKYQEVGTLDYRITSVGCEVEVTATIHGQNFTQKLYPMDKYNQPIMKPTIKDINKAQLRCLVKALATAGLGLNVYAGEDLPTSADEVPVQLPRYNTNQMQRIVKKAKAYDVIKAKLYTVQVGDQRRRLVEIMADAKKGDQEAQGFIDTWRKGKKSNERIYQFIIEQKLVA